MAKILVADDNSNVQKTVTLALANLGIEVLAVNNGDAAVKKLADFSPDLVLADIFMPVRNGYEVCEYIKKDTRFANVPVVLLVGAFDPLDEKEAQRVGADGILKKPFVPPDPLIAMVKMLLERTLGERLAEMKSKQAEVSAVTARAKSHGGVVTEERPSAASTAALTADEAPVTDFPAPVEPVAFTEGHHPVAFSQLLETPSQDSSASGAGVIELVDDEQILTSSRDANLGDPIFWRNDEAEAEPEEKLQEGSTSGDGMHTWKQPDDSLPRREDAVLLRPIEAAEPLVHSVVDHILEPVLEPGQPSLDPQIEKLEASGPMELVHEEQEETSQTVVDPIPVVLDPADQTSLTVDADKAEELAANPIEWMATAPLEHAAELTDETAPEHTPEFSSDVLLELSPELTLDHDDSASQWDTPIPDATDTMDAANFEAADTEEVKHPTGQLGENFAEPQTAEQEIKHQQNNQTDDHVAHKLESETAKPSASTPETATEKASWSLSEHVAKAAEVQGVESIHDAELEVERLVDPAAHSVGVSENAAPETHVTQPVNLDVASTKTAPSVSQTAADTVRCVPKQDWADLTASLRARKNEFDLPPGESVPQPNRPFTVVGLEHARPEPDEAEKASAPDPALVEAVVQRVLDKMRPQVVDIITKEFLRPIVQALVQREIEKS